MKTNDLILVVGILGILFCGYFLIIGKDTSTSLIGFISGSSLIYLWSYLRKKTKKI
ncbi:hypothetical protein DFQ11_1031 [Winogradskyella epiphytica]|uniref:Uncharacterized protein n=1 Tax=Winogradskyella epiphytica TaxID=262005 RepID=A0A2V4XS81_9FLAO|nr:hypothetical protein [Winogradskyella epiphytica]PYE80921.1 hypothetical protein DFQ11_1031 [Winogradskyella epiphytica]